MRNTCSKWLLSQYFSAKLPLLCILILFSIYSICFVSYSWKHIQNVILYTYPSIFVCKAFLPSKLEVVFLRQRRGTKTTPGFRSQSRLGCIGQRRPSGGVWCWSMKNDLISLEVAGLFWVVKVLIPHGQSTWHSPQKVGWYRAYGKLVKGEKDKAVVSKIF